MFKQIILPILGVIAFIVLVGIFVQKSNSLNFSNLIYPTPTPQKTITVGDKTILVQVAKTADERSRGLSGVTSLDKDSGMIFVFEKGDTAPIFWMKDMLIPLDIIWIKEGKVIRIDKNVPAPAAGTADANLKQYSAGTPVDYVLEVNAGYSDANSIKVGDSVNLTGF